MSPLTLCALAAPLLFSAPQSSDLREVTLPAGLLDGDFDASYEALLARLERGEGPEEATVRRLADLDIDGDSIHRTAANGRRLLVLADKVANAEASYQLRRMARRAFDAGALSEPQGFPAEVPGFDLFGEFVKHWHVVGPLGSPDEFVGALAPAPESSPEAELGGGVFGATYVGVDGSPRSWRQLDRPVHDPSIRMARHVHPDSGVVYAASFFRVEGDEAFDLELEVRTAGSFQAWWNGEAAIRTDRLLPSDVGSARRAAVRFVPGWNSLLVRMPGSDAGVLAARFLHADGSVAVGGWTQTESVPGLGVTAPEIEARRPRFSVPGASGLAWTNHQAAALEVERPRPASDIDFRLDGEVYGEGIDAALLEMLRLKGAGRDDVVLTMPAPEGPEDVLRGWHQVRLRSIESAGHLAPDARRRMQLETLLALDALGDMPPLARWSQVRLLLREDRPAEAHAFAQQWCDERPGQLLPRFARALCLRAIDRTGALAMPEIRGLIESRPTHIGARQLLMDLLDEQGDIVGALGQAKAILQLDATNDAAFDRVLEGLGGGLGAEDGASGAEPMGLRSDPFLLELLTACEARAALLPESRFWSARVRRLHDVLGDRDRLVGLARERVAEEPGDPEVWWRLAGALLRVGERDGAVAALRKELELEPGDPTSSELLAQLGEQSPAERFFEAFAPDIDAALERATDVMDASVVEALDDGLIYMYPNGSALTRSHTLSIARDRSGTEALSRTPSVGVTREKRVLAKDGRLLEPVLTNDEWVLPSLEPGDVVESVWDSFEGAVRGGQPATAGWRFASFEKAFPTSRWVVFVPDGLARGRVELGNFEGTTEVIPFENGKVYLHVASSARQTPEPFQPSYREVLPWAAFGDDRSLEYELRAWRARIARMRHLPADLLGDVEAFARAAVGDRTGVERARALYDALEARLQDHEGGPNAARVWQTRSGDPLCLLAEMYRMVGIEHRFAVVQRSVSPELDAEPIEAFVGERPLERAVLYLPPAEPDEDATWIVPLNAPGLPFGAVPAAMGGAAAFVLEPDGTTREEVLPRPLDEWDLEVRLTYRIADDGSAEVVGRTIEGAAQGAILARRIAEATEDQRSGYALNVASQFARGADVDASEAVVDGSEGPGVVVVFAGTTPGFLQPRGQESVAFLPFVPLQLTQRFGPVERSWPLALRQPIRLRATLHVQHGEQWKVVDGPRPSEEVREGLSVTLDVDTTDPAVTKFTQTFVQGGAVVEPADMAAFLESMAQLQAEFERPLQLKR